MRLWAPPDRHAGGRSSNENGGRLVTIIIIAHGVLLPVSHEVKLSRWHREFCAVDANVSDVEKNVEANKWSASTERLRLTTDELRAQEWQAARFEIPSKKMEIFGFRQATLFFNTFFLRERSS